jgi:hypothetical protein
VENTLTAHMSLLVGVLSPAKFLRVMWLAKSG